MIHWEILRDFHLETQKHLGLMMVILKQIHSDSQMLTEKGLRFHWEIHLKIPKGFRCPILTEIH